MTIQNIELNDGRSIPQLGFGTFKVPPERTQEAVETALELGYRHIDTATVYGNEHEVGLAIAASGLDRDSLWVTTKLWNDKRGREATRAALGESLEKLGLDYVDMYLIHWPAVEEGKLEETWETFGELRQEGLTKTIGVSNFDHNFLPQLAETGLMPAVTQVELHPQFQQRKTQEIAARLNVKIEAWGPLGQNKVDYASTVIGDIARAHDASWVQVIIAWHLAEGRIIFPKATGRDHQQQNFDASRLVLTDSEIAAIDALDKGEDGRVSANPVGYHAL